jgi:hypothetical protein
MMLPGMAAAQTHSSPTVQNLTVLGGITVNLGTSTLTGTLAQSNGGTGASGIGSAVFTGTGGSSSLSLVNHLNWITYAKDFGVKCDGSTDDTTALNAAITAANGNNQPGNIVQLPSGVCVISGQLNMLSLVTLRGTGPPQSNGTTHWTNGTQLDFTSTTITGPAITSPGGTPNFNAVNFIDLGVTAASTATYDYLAQLYNWGSSRISNTVWNTNAPNTACIDLVNQNPNGGTTYGEAWVDKVQFNTFNCPLQDMLTTITDSVFMGNYFAGSSATGTPLPIVEIGGGDNRFVGNMIDNNPNGIGLEVTPLVSGASDNTETIAANMFQNNLYNMEFTNSTAFHFGDSVTGNVFSRNATNTLGDIVFNNAEDVEVSANHQDYVSASQDVMVITTGTDDYLNIVGNGTEYGNWGVICAAHDIVYGNGPNSECYFGDLLTRTTSFVASLTSGATTTLAAGLGGFYAENSSAVATQTFKLPSTTSGVRQSIWIGSLGGVTTATFQTSAAGSITGAPTSIAAGNSHTFYFDGTNWYPRG